MMETKVYDQAYIKQSNIHAVLELLRERQPVSRKDIIGLTKMSPTSITRIVNALLDLSLIREEGIGNTAGRGRKAIQLTTNPDGLYTLGIFVDSLSLTLCVQNFDGQILYKAQSALLDTLHTAHEIAQAAYAMYKRVPRGVIRHARRLQGVGISVPGVVNHHTGVVENCIRMQWREVNLAEAFEQVFHLPILLENDVKAALIGEKERLGIPSGTDVAYLYLSRSGIGTGMTSSGELVRGEHNAAGEVAHIVLTPSDIPCDCGQYGCLQLHLVEHFLVQRARKIEPSIQTMEGIVAAYRQKLAWAEVLLSDFRRHLLLVFSLLDSFCNPAKIIVSGSIFQKLGDLLEEVLTDQHIIVAPDYAGASVAGAASMAMRHVLTRRLADNEEA